MLIIWQACARCSACALERVRLPLGRRVCNAVRVLLGRRASHLKGMRAKLSGCF